MQATLIKHSRSTVSGKEIFTFELEYPRIIHSELMTHRLFSRNAASSRAIPINKLIDLVETNLAQPSEWGLNQSGMQAKGVHNHVPTCRWTWKRASERAVRSAKELQELGLHKQICNRVIEPFQFIKTIVTTTELDNWTWLRDHADADPTIADLAGRMVAEVENSTPFDLDPGEYHLPYIYTSRCSESGDILYSLNDEDHTELTLEDAIKISTSCCAQVSYRVLDHTLEKALKIYDQLVTMSPVHASPFEHVATPMEAPTWGGMVQAEYSPYCHSEGEKLDHNGDFWSGNFRHWYQYRQQIPNNAKWEDEE